MNDTVRTLTLSVFLLTCTLALGSLLAIYLLVDKHHKARLAKDYAEIEACMKSELERPTPNTCAGSSAISRNAGRTIPTT